jgi:MFS transporter, LPLT family, lysophospholipid transporter
MLPKLSPLNALFVAQFLSAFVDNMILFIALAIIRQDGFPDFYLPLVQSTFLLSFIVLSPWVGRYADKNAKASVLIHGNIIKGVGVILFFLGCDPAVSYAVVGIGAVVYSPAKYGILPLLTTSEKELLHANSYLESYTIVAILAGSVGGGFLSDLSIPVALAVAVGLYGASVLFNLLIPQNQGDATINYRDAIGDFRSDVATLASMRQSHYSLAGTGSFWLASATLRVAVFAWLPLVIGITSNTEIGLTFAATGIGLALGAMITPWLITIQSYRRTLYAGMAIALLVFSFNAIHSLPVTIAALFAIGTAGGVYIVPLNACLQNIGHKSIGAGKTIAVQNFIENSFMFLGVAAYTASVKSGVEVNMAISAIGIMLVIILGYMFFLKDKAG